MVLVLQTINTEGQMCGLPSSRVWIAGHDAMVGSAIWRALAARQSHELLGWTSSELDLLDREATIAAAQEAQPDIVIVAASRTGGIGANSADPVGFFRDNVRAQTNVLEAAHIADVNRLLFVGASCVYPRNAPQPMKPASIMTGPLEKSSDGYAMAKLAGIAHVNGYRRQFGRSWVTSIPTTLYGPGDDFDFGSAHVLPALIHRFSAAKASNSADVTLWGSGTARREFLHVDDFAQACLAILDCYDDETPINVGAGGDQTIAELAALVASVVGFSGEILWDRTRPDGAPQKLLDSRAIRALGWQPQVALREGIADTYKGFLGQSLPSERTVVRVPLLQPEQPAMD